jgi:hypothetical protein
MRRALLPLLLVGCAAGDPCDGVVGSCVAVEVRAAEPSLAALEQLRFASTELALDGRTPDPPRAFRLPVRAALIVGAAAGTFRLHVDGLVRDVAVGADDVNGTVRAGEHTTLIATLTATGAAVPDAAPPVSDGGALPDAGARDLAAPRDGAATVTWSKQTSPAPASAGLMDVWGSGAGDVYAVGGDGTTPLILHSTGNGQWAMQTSTVSFDGTYRDGVGGSGKNDVWVGNEYRNNVFHSTGNGTWTAQTVEQVPATDNVEHYAIWASGPADVFAVGSKLMHFNGTAWSEQNPSTLGLYNSVFGTGPTNIWVVGQTSVDPFGIVMRSTGDGGWVGEKTPNKFANGVWLSGPRDIYVVGHQGFDVAPAASIVRSTGDGTWTDQSPTGVPHFLNAIFGTGPGDLYAVGEAGTILHSTGNGQWTAEGSGTMENLLGVWASGPNDVYVVGTNNTILHKP